jgi:hypothetical protein
MLEVVPHVQAAQFGQIDQLRALLDNTPELIDQANDRGMTALMAAAHGGHAEVVKMLLERGADVTCRDDRGVSALDYAIRENKQEVARALLDSAGAKVEALKKGLNIESAAMLAKIGAEKGIMISGMSRDQTQADFSNQGLQPADTILIGSDLKLMAGVTTLDLSVNRIGDDGAKVIAEALKVKDSKIMSLDASSENIGPVGGKLISEALRTSVTGALTRVDVRHNNIAGDGAVQLAAAVLGNLKIEMFNEIPIKEMRANSLTELDLNGKGVGVEGVMVVAGLIPVMGALTEVWETCQPTAS